MNLPPERDASGRFVKPDQDAPKPTDDDMHPTSKLLFGWVSSPRTPLIFLILVVVISIGLGSVRPGCEPARISRLCQCQWLLRHLGLCRIRACRSVWLAARQTCCAVTKTIMAKLTPPHRMWSLTHERLTR